MFILHTSGFINSYHRTIRILIGCEEQAETVAYVLDHIFGFDVEIEETDTIIERSDFEAFMAAKLCTSIHNYMEQ